MKDIRELEEKTRHELDEVNLMISSEITIN